MTYGCACPNAPLLCLRAAQVEGLAVARMHFGGILVSRKLNALAGAF